MREKLFYFNLFNYVQSVNIYETGWTQKTLNDAFLVDNPGNHLAAGGENSHSAF